MDEKKNNEIEKHLVDLLHQRFCIPLSSLGPNNWTEPLTGVVFKLTGVDLVYPLFELEKHYQTKIVEEFLQNYRFNSICEIAKTIKQSKVSKTVNYFDNRT